MGFLVADAGDVYSCVQAPEEVNGIEEAGGQEVGHSQVGCVEEDQEKEGIGQVLDDVEDDVRQKVTGHSGEGDKIGDHVGSQAGQGPDYGVRREGGGLRGPVFDRNVRDGQVCATASSRACMGRYRSMFRALVIEEKREADDCMI